MKNSWTEGVESDAKEEIERSFNAAALIRKRLEVMLTKKQKTNYNASLGKEGYDCPNWAYKQADARGYERALKEVAELLK